ncbi:hypothetical protein [Pendulispora albinea]|uniref:RNA polymerase sigma-70 region 2 domain-containing protein n=1 Tax=Pendulispora albinea TaxID=2741071 RepID=A0ABZ2LM14_9BACT
MQDDGLTDINRFPTTRASAILGVKSADGGERARSIEEISLAYWKPVYKYTRLRWRRSPEETQDITQDFFLKALEKNFFAAYDPSKARFRVFVRVCLDRFIIDRDRVGRAVKRGGVSGWMTIDFSGVEGEIQESAVLAPDAFDAFFDREWMRHVLGMAVDRLSAECSAKGKELHFRIFERFYLQRPAEEEPTYAKLAKEFAVSETDVTNRLSFARREFRRVVLDTLRGITASEAEFRNEARALLGTIE